RQPALDCPRVSIERLPEVIPKEARLIGGDAGKVALRLLIGVKDGLLFRGKRRRCRPRGQFVTLPGVWVIERVSPRLVVAQRTIRGVLVDHAGDVVRNRGCDVRPGGGCRRVPRIGRGGGFRLSHCITSYSPKLPWGVSEGTGFRRFPSCRGFRIPLRRGA